MGRRYVKYFERILAYLNGENPPARRCMLRGFRLHNCPYWIRPSITISDHNVCGYLIHERFPYDAGILFSTRKHPKTKDLMPEDFWIRAPKKRFVVFALPGEPGLTELRGDFKIQFHDRQGDFYCWLNTTMMENRIFLNHSDLDGFDKRKIPSPGFQVEIVMVDYNGSIRTKKKPEQTGMESDRRIGNAPTSNSDGVAAVANRSKATQNQDTDDVFSDSEGEESVSSKNRQAQAAASGAGHTHRDSGTTVEQMTALTHRTQQISVGDDPTQSNASNKPTKIDVVERSESGGMMSSDIKAIAADASVFTFGDEDYESE
ncbi:Phosphoric monoester hydrolase [Sarracenia purpurea var. burkii]